MRQPQTLPGSGKVALKYGLIFGGAIGLIDIIYSVILDAANPGFLDSLAQALSSLNGSILFSILYVLIISLPIYLLLFVAFLLAGRFAARQTHKTSTGLLAGLWAAVLFVVIDLLIANLGLEVLIVFPQIQREDPAAAASIEQSILFNIFFYGIVAGVILIGLGLGIGALGGAMGKGKALPQPAYPTPQPAYPPAAVSAISGLPAVSDPTIRQPAAISTRTAASTRTVPSW